MDYKSEFLKTITDNAYNRRILFRVLPEYEKQYHKDTSAFRKQEILTVLEDIDSSTINVLRGVYKLMAKYTDWMVENGYASPQDSDYRFITSEDIEDCLNPFKKDNVSVSFDELREIIHHEVRNPVDKFIILCLFEGIKGSEYEEILNMKLDDIDPVTKTVKLCTGREITVDDDFYSIAKEADEATTFDSYDKELVFLPNEGRIAKALGGLNSTPKALGKLFITSKVGLIRSELEYPFLTIPRLLNSGFGYHCLKEMEEKGMTAEEFVKTPECDKLRERYGYTDKKEFQSIARIKKCQV